MSPRTSSLPSDKQSSSPAQSVIHAPNEQRAPPTPAPSQERKSPQRVNAESHAAKTARMEATASQGFGGGIPPKIEEGIEPGEQAGKVK